jgi:microcystin-dependent protein
MATVTKGRTFTSGETVTPAKLNNVVDLATVTNIQTADIADGQVTDAKLATGIDASKITTGTLPIARIADGDVTLAKLVTAVQQSLLPAGAVQAFAMNSAPAGWLAADGSNVNRTTYAALFSALGTTYGAGDGSTTFALPDLRGIFVRGSGSQTISGTTYNKAFALKERDALQGHWHATQHTLNASGSSGSGALSPGSGFGITSVRNPSSDGVNGTPRTAAETRPANIALLYCIKF